MFSLQYYFFILVRRLHYFLAISVMLAAAAIIAAVTLPPAYVSQTRLLLEGPQIPTELASSTVSVGLNEQLEVIRQRLMTRANLLSVARSQDVFEDIQRMRADEIVEAMESRTLIVTGDGRNPIPIMQISFEARTPQIAAGVLNEFLTLIEQQNLEFRTARAGGTLEFFENEVERLGEDLDAQSTRILEFQTRNASNLPESLSYRLSQQTSMQDQLDQINRDITMLRNQEDRLMQQFQGRRGTTNLERQLSEIETRIAMLEDQRSDTSERLDALTETIERTPGSAIELEELRRNYANIEEQYNLAVDRLARASTGERIEALSRGQRISVIEPPATPDRPTKPNRVLIAGGGTVLGMAAGIGLVFLLELVNGTARRPEDIVKHIGVRPLATLPYIYSRNELAGKRMVKVVTYLAILVGLPLAIYAVHLYHLPLDLLAERMMNRIGMRW